MEIQTIILANKKPFKYLYAGFKEGKQFLWFNGWHQVSTKYLVKENERAFYDHKMKYWIIRSA
jgi:hypothetical protein